MISGPRPLKWPPTFPLQKGLVLWLPFGERSGVRVFDRSGKLHHGTLSGATWAAMQRASGLKFNGVNNYVSLGNDVFSQAKFVNGLTLATWIKLSSLDAVSQYLLCIEGRINLRVAGNSDKAVFEMYDGAWRVASESDALVTDTWYFIAGTWDKTTVRVYVNAVLGDVTEASGIGLIDAVSRPVLLSAYFDFTTGYVDGLMKWFRVYDRALNVAELKRLSESELMLARH